MTKGRRAGSIKTRPRAKPRHASPSRDGKLITRRRDPFAREWVPLSAEARALGFNWRTLRRHVATEPFVRVLVKLWYVRHLEFLAWWEKQRPTKAARGRSA